MRPEVGLGRHRLHRDAEPARAHAGLFLCLAKRRQAKFLSERPALLGGARQAEDLLGEKTVAGKGTVGRLHDHVWLKPEKVAIGFVRVEHAAALVGDERPLRKVVDEGLGDVVARLRLAEMQDADGAGEQAEHADHGEAAKDGEDERLGHLARDHGEADGGHGETKRERHHESDIAAAAGLICGWLGVTRRRVDVGHASKLPDSISVRAGHCDVARCCSSPAQIHDRTGHFPCGLRPRRRSLRFVDDRRAGGPREPSGVILVPWLTVY